MSVASYLSADLSRVLQEFGFDEDEEEEGAGGDDAESQSETGSNLNLGEITRDDVFEGSTQNIPEIEKRKENDEETRSESFNLRTDWLYSGFQLLWQAIQYVSSAVHFSGSGDPPKKKQSSQSFSVRLGDLSQSETLKNLGDQYAMLNEAFKMFDLDGSGRISRSELRDVLRNLGHNPNEQQINLLIAQVDVDGNGTLDLSEFMQFMSSHFCVWNPANDLGAVFRLLDPKGTGFVRAGHLREMLLRYSSEMSESEVDEMLSMVSDEDFVDLKTFMQIVIGKD